jgi:hypothetical protein
MSLVQGLWLAIEDQERVKSAARIPSGNGLLRKQRSTKNLKSRLNQYSIRSSINMDPPAMLSKLSRSRSNTGSKAG